MNKIKNIIELAQSRGSSATTNSGARRYLLQKIANNRDTTPLHARGLRSANRSASTVRYYVQQRLERRAAAVCAGLGLWPRDEAEVLASEINAGILAQYKSAITESATYRVAQSRWAGGDHSTSISFADSPEVCAASGSSERAWSANGKWSGKNSQHEFKISRRLPLQLAVVGGLVSLDAVEIAPREYQAVWAEQARGFDLKIVRGFIIRGYHVGTDNLARARKLAAAARAKTLATRVAERTRRNANRALNAVWVTIEDSRRAGNCAPATESVAAKIRRDLGGDVYAVRGDCLLSVRDDVYARRAIAAAQQR